LFTRKIFIFTSQRNERNSSFADRPMRQSGISGSWRRSELSFGKLYPTSTEWTQQEGTTETPISNWSASMFTSMKPAVGSMCRVRFSSILSRVRWTRCGLARSDSCSVRTTSSSDNLALEITGQRVTTPKVS
jgi:hypothetical protein